MKSQVVIVALLAAVALGFGSGFYCSRQVLADKIEKQNAADIHGSARWLASENTKVLQYLAEGQQAKARAILEHDLDAAVINVVLYWQNFGAGMKPAWDVSVVRRVRDYRSHHPWSEPSQRTDALQHAFEWAE